MIGKSITEVITGRNMVVLVFEDGSGLEISSDSEVSLQRVNQHLPANLSDHSAAIREKLGKRKKKRKKKLVQAKVKTPFT